MSDLINFTKMHGLGNDFIVIDAVSQAVSLSKSQIIWLSDRHLGIGCDQVLLIEKSADPEFDFFYRIYNSDGSESGQCGNGARCIAKFISDKNLNNLGLDDFNIGFMQIIDKNNIKLRVFERGAGETQACGSGACAAVIAGITQNLLNHTVTVELPGGKLYIEWQGEPHPVWMTGPAETVFEGNIKKIAWRSTDAL